MCFASRARGQVYYCKYVIIIIRRCYEAEQIGRMFLANRACGKGLLLIICYYYFLEEFLQKERV